MKSPISKSLALALIPLLLTVMSGFTFWLIFFNQESFGSLELELRVTIFGLGLFSLFFGLAKIAYNKHNIRIFFLSFSSSLIVLFFVMTEVFLREK